LKENLKMKNQKSGLVVVKETKGKGAYGSPIGI